jgi:hypothetical protein
MRRQILYKVPKLVKFIETKSRMVIARSWEVRGTGGYCSTHTEFLFLEMQGVIVHNNVSVCTATEL